MAKEYILSDITPKVGTRHNSYIWDITWVDLDDLQIHMTVVDESMPNFTRSHWDVIVAGDIPYGIYSGLVRTNKTDKDGLSVISADSHPTMIAPLTMEEVYRVIDIRKQQLGLE